MYSKVEICGVDTSKLPLINNDQKMILLGRIKEGDNLAREEFIKGNLRLVLSVVKKFKNRNENIDDIFQIGCIGLIKAIDNFDMSYNVLFSTYAVPMIVGEIRRYLRDNNAIRVSRSVRDTAFHALNFKERYIACNSREPTLLEMATELGVDEKAVANALDAIQDPISLFEPVYNDNGDVSYVMDHVRDKDGDEHWLEDLALRQGIEKLNSREKKIISMRFYEGKTQMEVADEIGISQAQVSRLEKSALKCIRKKID
ncbi:MAG: RNA polymerase sporulation sigma factor SigG [Clostridiales bacterium]|nr:RNA polymerase sporulation sigma factor SigG [Clostridiales bacterium]